MADTRFDSGIPSYLIAADNHQIAGSEDGNSMFSFGKFAAGAAVGAAAGTLVAPVLGTAAGGLIGFAATAGGAILGGLTAKTDGKFLQAAVVSGRR